MSAHEAERRRDVPASCACDWEWDRHYRRWFRLGPRPDLCWWHYPQGYPQPVSKREARRAR